MRWKFLTCLVITAGLVWAPEVTRADSFSREDWIYTAETTHPNYWGVQWGINSFTLPYRALQRGRDELFSHHFNNFNSADGKVHVGGVLGRFVLGFETNIGLFYGTMNLHHSMGHDAAARELSQDWGLGNGISKRTKQVLPYYLGGRQLGDQERQVGGGADAQTQYMVQPMQAAQFHRTGQLYYLSPPLPFRCVGGKRNGDARLCHLSFQREPHP